MVYYFIIPHSDNVNIHKCPWHDTDSYLNEQYIWENNMWQRFGAHSKMLKPWTEHADKLFQNKFEMSDDDTNKLLNDLKII